jgi:hypothetical protein
VWLEARSEAVMTIGKDAEKPDWSPLIDAYAQLAKSVDYAFRLNSDLPLDVKIERERFAAALICVGRFFSTFRAPFANQFFELGSAIVALNDGIQHGLLKPTKAARMPNRPPDPPQLWRARANVVLAVYALEQFGLTSLEIANKIDRISGLKNLVSKKRTDDEVVKVSNTVAEWRKDFKSDKLKKNWEVDTFYEAGKELIEFIAANDEGRLVDFANHQLAAAVAAAKFCRMMSPPEEPISCGQPKLPPLRART